MGDQSKDFNESIRREPNNRTFQCHGHARSPIDASAPNPSQPYRIREATSWADLMSVVGESKYRYKDIIVSTSPDPPTVPDHEPHASNADAKAKADPKAKAKD